MLSTTQTNNFVEMSSGDAGAMELLVKTPTSEFCAHATKTRDTSLDTFEPMYTNFNRGITFKNKKHKTIFTMKLLARDVLQFAGYKKACVHAQNIRVDILRKEATFKIDKTHQVRWKHSITAVKPHTSDVGAFHVALPSTHSAKHCSYTISTENGLSTGQFAVITPHLKNVTATIDGKPDFKLTANYKTLVVYSDGVNWFRVR